MKNSVIFGSVVKDPNFKQGKKVEQDDFIAAINRIYDKRYPIVPNAKKDIKTSKGRKK